MDGGGYGRFNTDGQQTAITLKSGKSWYVANVPVSTRGFSEAARNGDAGPYYEIACDVFIPFYNQHNHQLLNAMPLYRYVCLILLPDGTTVVMGSTDNGARFEQGYDTTANFKGIPGTRGRFTWQHSAKCPVLYVPS